MRLVLLRDWLGSLQRWLAEKEADPSRLFHGSTVSHGLSHLEGGEPGSGGHKGPFRCA